MRVGSRVMLGSLLGTVEWVSDSEAVVDVRLDDYASPVEYVPVELLELLPEPLKVGDTIRGQDAYEALPAGAMVKSGWGDFVVRTDDGYVDMRGTTYPPRSLSMDRPLVFLPEAS